MAVSVRGQRVYFMAVSVRGHSFMTVRVRGVLHDCQYKGCVHAC